MPAVLDELTIVIVAAVTAITVAELTYLLALSALRTVGIDVSVRPAVLPPGLFG